MKVIITGGAGFIGGHAVKHFIACGDDVINVDKMTYAAKKENTVNSTFIKIDITNSKDINQVIEHYKPDFVIHFAAETHVDNSIKDCKEFIKTNVEGTTCILDACLKTKTKLCHISTDEVYGPATNRAFIESDELQPMNPYAVSKAAADMMIKAYYNTHGLQHLIVRPSNNYGPGQHPEKFIPKLIDCLNSNKKFPLYGVGDQEREWTFVKDTVKRIRSLLLCQNTQWNSIYNLSSNITLTNAQTAQRIVSIYNDVKNTNININDVVIQSKDRPGHDKKYWISSDKLNSIIPQRYTTFNAGVRETLKTHE